MDSDYPAGFVPLFACRVPSTIVAREAELVVPPVVHKVSVPPEHDALRAVALFQATLRDLLEERLHALLRAIASDILARELALAPADIRAIVTRMLVTCATQTPLEVHVSAIDAPRLPPSGLPVRVDATLQHGEAAIAIGGGTFESRLQTRLDHVLEALAP